mmetsp:Transcript_45374/g.66561  ORF Transcript_45374/g.66561 Transcript_45374/m.66561 type:complete len:106 (+) Transcript_45374:284-601(+)
MSLSNSEIVQSLRMCQRYHIYRCHMHLASLQVGTSDTQWRLWYTRRNQETLVMAAAGQLEHVKLTSPGMGGWNENSPAHAQIRCCSQSTRQRNCTSHLSDTLQGT